MTPRDRGAADALGLVLIAPAVIGLALLVVALGRAVDARAQVRAAAEAGAQAAALERDALAGDAAAHRAVRAGLRDVDACADPAITVERRATTGAGAPTGGIVTVTVRCVVSDRGVEPVGRGDRVEAVSASATLDLFRGAGP